MDDTNKDSGATLVALSDGLATAAANAARFVVAVHARQRIASSGILWRPGVVVTASHAIKREDDLRVTLPDGTRVRATLAGRDEGTDVAVLRVDETIGEPLSIGESSTPKVGNFVLALARDEDGDLCASFGAVSSVSGPWRTWRGGQIDRFVRLDLALYPGFSGGPLVDAHGAIVGMNTSGLTRNVSVSVPMSTLNRATRELLERGHIPRGYLGVGMQPVALPASLQSMLGTDANTAVMILSLAPGGPAETAGIMLGDIVVALDGHAVTAIEDVQAALGTERIGGSVLASVVRGGKVENVAVTIGEWPREGQ
jgi:S1-C subfamily serine protease